MNILQSVGKYESPKDCVVETDNLLLNLKRAQAKYAERLNDVTAAIQALESNPEVSKILELLARV